MKMKLAIFYGILIWVFTWLITELLNHVLSTNLPYHLIVIPLIMIIVTGFFEILYIRNFDENEVIEGILSGMVFIIIDIIFDYIFFIYLNNYSILIGNYRFHLFSTIILTLLITTFLGYLAQMTIDLK